MDKNRKVVSKNHTSKVVGFLGLGFSLILMNLKNVGIKDDENLIAKMGFVYGMLALIIAGLKEWNCSNHFYSVMFTSYALFWASLLLV